MKDDTTRETNSSKIPGQGQTIGVEYATYETHKSQILVPLDGSELAEKALPHAIALARATSAGITLLRVVPPNTFIEPIGGALIASPALWEVWAAEPQLARNYLQAVADKLRDTELVVQTAVLEGNPAGEIVSYVGDHLEVSRVVMFSHGRSAMGRWVMGSVAETVLHASSVPLLVVRPENDEPDEPGKNPLAVPEYKTILVPLDGSELSEQALGEAQILAKKMGATVVLVSVTSTPFDLVLTKVKGTQAWTPTPLGEAVQQLNNKLDAVSKRLECGNVVVEARLTYGDPADEILKLSEEVGADIIVMATHGRGGLAGLLIGSVATRVMQAAHIPVLLVRVKAGAVQQAPSEQRVEQKQALELATLL